MRNFKIPLPSVSIRSASEQALSILSSVNSLAHYDMIYIYHHLVIGSELKLIRAYNNPINHHAIEVYFKGFKLGYICDKQSPIIAKILDNQQEVKAYAKNIHKLKYRPLSGLDIEVVPEVN